MFKQKLIILGLMAAFSTTAFSFSLDSISKKAAIANEVCKYAGKEISEKNLVSIQKGILGDTKKVSQNYLGAQAKLANALNLKEAAATIEAQNKLLKKGNINADKLDKTTTVGGDATKAIEAQLKKVEQLTADQKKKVSESLGQYGDAALGTALVAGKTVLASGAVLCVASNDLAKAGKIKSNYSYLIDAASTLPGFSKDLITTGFSYIELLKSFDVDTSVLEKKLKQASKVKIDK